MVSIIIVYYHVEKELFDCLTSIYKQSKTAIEVIVVDNDENPVIEKQLHKKFPKVIYVKSPKNLGYSGGHNLGATYAKGDFLFFLNPDTLFTTNVIDTLVSFFKKNPNAGAVAPLLLDTHQTPYPLQGTKKLGILQALVALSIVNKLFPKNPISKKYWQSGWDKTKVKQVDIVPGTAFMIRKKIFEEIGKFDQRYFLFFEEYDICRRLIERGYKNYILPNATLVHLWGNSTAYRRDIDKIFRKSRFLYFQKFYSTPVAVCITAILGISTESLSISLLVLIATLVRFYALDKLMVFLGDFAWFYLSAKDLLIQGQIPLVGIASSHPWLHQGALWTYMLATSLLIGNFNPLAGGYVAAGIGVLTVLLLYIFTKEMFGKRTAFFATAFFATSPFIIFHSRLPYHTAPIPLFVLLYLYALYKWVQGSSMHFIFVILWLVFLYNFELATSVLVIPFFYFFVYGIWKQQPYIKQLRSVKIMILSFCAFFIPMFPMIVYDLFHGFPQTVGYLAWIGYRILLLVGYSPVHTQTQSGTYSDIVVFLIQSIQKTYYLPNIGIAILLFLGSIGFFVARIGKENRTTAYTILLSGFFVPFLTIMVSKIPSDAYLPMLFIQMAMIVGWFFSYICGKNIMQIRVTYVFVLLLCLTNMVSLFQHDYFGGITFAQRKSAAKEIIVLAHGNPYDIFVEGYPQAFPTLTMNYEYLTWWLGNPSQKGAEVKIVVRETNNGISVLRK
jgi:GT2 family glycosyltransferase